METQHKHMLETLSQYWDKNAVKLNPFECLSLVDWTFKYSTALQRFGIKDDALDNGFVVLCNSYARKVYTSLMPHVITCIKKEKSMEQCIETTYIYNRRERNEVEVLSTKSPTDIIDLFK
jgi:hypothetical protein